jgi:hypothetical protein
MRNRPSDFPNVMPADILARKLGYGSKHTVTSALPNPEAKAEDEMTGYLKLLASFRTITKSLVTRAVTITTQPTLIVRATEPRSYTIINPTPAIGLTTTATFFNGNIAVAGNTQLTPVGVSNYDTMHFFAAISNAAGLTLNLIVQVQNPITGNWIDTQDIVPAGITANGDIYANLSNFGIVTNFAVRWTIAGSCTLALGYALKGGLGGSSQGSVNTVFLGNSGVTLNTGFPLLEGQFRDYNFRENAEMYATALQTVSINIIEYT